MAARESVALSVAIDAGNAHAYLHIVTLADDIGPPNLLHPKKNLSQSTFHANWGIY